MPKSITRSFGPDGYSKRLVWTYGNNTRVRAWAWGGGGGGGGYDGPRPGGYGGGGGFGYSDFFVNNGDVLDISVGGGGGNGLNNTANYGGGGGGGAWGGNLGSLEIFNTRASIPNGWTADNWLPQYNQFHANYGVWQNPYSVGLDYTWPINFAGGTYTVQVGYAGLTYWYDYLGEWWINQAGPSMQIQIDGVPVISVTVGALGAATPTEFNVTLSPGVHNFRAVTPSWNAQYAHGRLSFAMRILNAGSFSGGRGGNAGPSNLSGAGGGGGGATTVWLNNTLMTCGAGGGGGGGGGLYSGGGTAPGPTGQASPGIYSGQNGQDHPGDGGGGGGGGGGYGGGNGGPIGGGDVGGVAGAYGLSYGLITANPDGCAPTHTPASPAGCGTPVALEYYNDSWGHGGHPGTPGAGGAAVLEFYVRGFNVKTNQGWKSIGPGYIKNNGAWREIQATWIKTGGQWQYTINGFAPVFQNLANWGYSSRDWPTQPGAPGGGDFYTW